MIDKRLSSIVYYSIIEPTIWDQCKYPRPSSLLLAGPSGSGKSFLINKLACKYSITVSVLIFQF